MVPKRPLLLALALHLTSGGREGNRAIYIPSLYQQVEQMQITGKVRVIDLPRVSRWMYFRVREKEDDVHSDVVSNIPRQWCLHSHDSLEETFSLAAECVLHQMYPAILVLIHEMLG